MTGKIAIYGIFNWYNAEQESILRYAKSLGDHLVIFLYDDELSAGAGGSCTCLASLNSIDKRCRVLQSIRYVDQVFIVSAKTLPLKMAEYRPDVLITNGDDLGPVNPEDVVAEYGGGTIPLKDIP